VGSAAVIIYKGKGEKQPCLYTLEEAGENKYSECIAQAISDSLKKLFAVLRNEPNIKPNSIVFPAIGTGIGGASKRAFYQTLKNILLSELKKPGDTNVLPSKIILLVWRNEEPDTWTAERTEIAQALYEMYDEWVSDEHKREDVGSLAGLIGISGTLLIVVLMLILRIPFPRQLRRERNLLSNRPIALVILGWFLAALGVLSILKPIANQLTERLNTSLSIQIFYGLIAVLAYGAISRATEMFKEANKKSEEDTPD
jgi:hypothetical protein